VELGLLVKLGLLADQLMPRNLRLLRPLDLVPPLVKELGLLPVKLYLLLPHQVFVNPPLPMMMDF